MKWLIPKAHRSEPLPPTPKGQIVIPLTLAGNYTVYECEAPNGYLLSEEPAQNVKVEYGKAGYGDFLKMLRMAT